MVGEYVGGILLILLMWPVVRLTHKILPVEEAREHARKQQGDRDDYSDLPRWRDQIRSIEGWTKIATRYFMEWAMVWKDVTVGFTVAGIIAAFVPRSFFQALFWLTLISYAWLMVALFVG